MNHLSMMKIMAWAVEHHYHPAAVLGAGHGQLGMFGLGVVCVLVQLQEENKYKSSRSLPSYSSFSLTRFTKQHQINL